MGVESDIIRQLIVTSPSLGITIFIFIYMLKREDKFIDKFTQILEKFITTLTRIEDTLAQSNKDHVELKGILLKK